MAKSRGISELKLKKAKEMFMNFEQVSKIARELKISRSSLDHHVKKPDGWELERNLRSAELFEQLNSSKKQDFTRMTQATIDILSKSLVNLSKRDRPPTMQEATAAAKILETLDRITRLDDGNPTDIIANEKPATVIEIQKKLKVDPFHKPKEIEHVEETD